jgi:hypothetical protein
MPSTADRRHSTRIDTRIPATVRWLSPAIATETANVSADGVYFVAQGALTVEVELEVAGRKRTVRGRLVRIDSRNSAHDALGIAVRLDEPIPVSDPERK